VVDCVALPLHLLKIVASPCAGLLFISHEAPPLRETEHHAITTPQK